MPSAFQRRLWRRRQTNNRQRNVRTVCGTPFDLDNAISLAEMDWDFGKHNPRALMVDNLHAIERLCNRKKAVLYRVVWPGPDGGVDFGELGRYYTWAIENYARKDEISLLEKLHEWNCDRTFADKDIRPEVEDAILVQVEVPSKHIDVVATLNELQWFPFDRTIVIKSDFEMKILAIAELRRAISETKKMLPSYAIDFVMAEKLLREGRKTRSPVRMHRRLG